MATATSTAHTLGRRAQEMRLEPYILELELDGLAFEPPTLRFDAWKRRKQTQ